MTQRHAAILVVCAGLAGCSVDSNRDATGPGTGVTTHDGSKGTGSHLFVRANGESFSAPVRAGTSLERLDAEVASQAAVAAATVCDAGIIDPNDGSPEGGLNGGTYTNIEVPPGAICVLSGVTVINSVKALDDSRLFIQSSEIGGNVRGLNASAVQASGGTTIAGNMNVQGAHDLTFASCSVDDVIIEGDLICADNDPGSPIIRAEQGPTVINGSVKLVDNVIPGGHVLLLLNSSVGTDVDVRRNGGAGHKEVTGNTVTGELACKKNDPTFIGGPNTAGTVKGQCF